MAHGPILRTYDARGRLTQVVSRSTATGGGWLNYANTQYWDAPLTDVNGLPFISYQSHDGATSLQVNYRFDSAASGGEYYNGLRSWRTIYPNLGLKAFAL
jgi:hypothetical protein